MEGVGRKVNQGHDDVSGVNGQPEAVPKLPAVPAKKPEGRLQVHQLGSDCSDFSDLEDEEEDIARKRNKNGDELSSGLANLDLDEDPLEGMTELERKILEKMMNDQMQAYGSRHGPRLIERAQTLENCKRFHITPETAPVGSILKLKMVKQYPNQQTYGKPLFELADLSEKYEEMEKDMVKDYTDFPTEPVLDLSQVRKGDYAVLQSWKDEEEEAENNEDAYYDTTPVLKRIKFISEALHKGTQTYKVEYIDYFFKKFVNCGSEILILDKKFAALPPRVSAIEMEGLSHYKHSELHKFILYDSKDYAFDGLLTAEVQPSGKVIVWSDRFPKDQHPYGINGFIITSIIQSCMGIAKLPPQGYSKPNGFVVYADNEGYISIQFSNAISKHFMELFFTISEEAIQKHYGSVEVPKVGEVYMAPHTTSDGSYYRAVLRGPSSQQPCNNDPVPGPGEVLVRYLDYGDEALVKIEHLVKASNIHFLLDKFPALYVRAHLENIWSLTTSTYFPKYHGQDQQYTVHVVKDADPGNGPAEVILKTIDQQGKTWIVNELIGNNEDMADPIIPYFDYSRYEDRGARAANWSLKALQYLQLDGGKRLKVGDEFDVLIKYDKAMPNNYFYMTPSQMYNLDRHMDVVAELSKIEDDIKKDRLELFIKRKIPFKGHVRENEWSPGMSVLCLSGRLEKLVRGVFIEELPKGKPDMYVTDEGMQFEHVRNDWRVYLLDYGIVETIDVVQIFETRYSLVELPAKGCLAHLKQLSTKEQIRKWWKRLPDDGLPPREDRLHEDVFDSTQAISRRVRIVSISMIKRFGELAEVEFCED